MSAKTIYVTERLWRSLPWRLRAEVMKVLWRSQVVRRYASNVESALRARGEHELARRFLETLGAYRYEQLRERRVSFEEAFPGVEIEEA